MNFFCRECQEPPIHSLEFGLCDDQNGTKAYTSTDTETCDTWAAIVKNPKAIEVIFTAIDKCIIQDNQEAGKGRCDGMITSREHIYFVELKNKQKEWKEDAINQLESSIILFMANHAIDVFKYKKAFACNKRHPYFQEIDNETKLRFFRKYKVRLDVHYEILIL